MRELLDPWDDAARIADRIAAPGSRLIVVIGAESWCGKCRSLKPVFEKLARRAQDSNLMIWFDVKEHQEFLGSYLPESLPEALVYEGLRLVSRSLLLDGDEASLLAALRTDLPDCAEAEDPGIARRLARKDWA
jgi:thiol-disulfide isomerase/thioredoxin